MFGYLSSHCLGALRGERTCMVLASNWEQDHWTLKSFFLKTAFTRVWISYDTLAFERVIYHPPHKNHAGMQPTHTESLHCPCSAILCTCPQAPLSSALKHCKVVPNTLPGHVSVPWLPPGDNVPASWSSFWACQNRSVHGQFYPWYHL